MKQLTHPLPAALTYTKSARTECTPYLQVAACRDGMRDETFDFHGRAFCRLMPFANSGAAAPHSIKWLQFFRSIRACVLECAGTPAFSILSHIT